MPNTKKVVSNDERYLNSQHLYWFNIGVFEESFKIVVTKNRQRTEVTELARLHLKGFIERLLSIKTHIHKYKVKRIHFYLKKGVIIDYSLLHTECKKLGINVIFD